MTRKPKNLPVNNVALNRFMVDNASLIRSDLIKSLLDPRIDMNYECGYPETITASEYHQMYDREGLAKKVVNTFPKECWAMVPEVFEEEEKKDTEFEVALDALIQQRQIWHFLERVDKLSGVGRFGVLLLGLDDGQPLNTPAAGLNGRGEAEGSPSAKLLFLRAFDESVVTVGSSETDPANPRFGLPMLYNILYSDESTGSTFSNSVHWSRIVHVADEREMSEVYGTPRMKAVYNRLLDIRKVLSGSGEMFWRGAFPGFSFEVNPDLKDATIDATAMRTEFENYSSGLQRYLALTGVTAKSLSPQVSDPTAHINAHLEYIAITMGIPKRILLGSERGELASSQDTAAWNKRLKQRQDAYLTPMLVKPFITRLIQLGVLPSTKETTEWGEPVYVVEWPDLNTVTDDEKATVAGKKTEALAKYVGGNVETVIPLYDFLTRIMQMEDEEAQAIVDAAEEHALELEEEAEADAAMKAEAAAAAGTPMDDDGNPVPPQQKPAIPFGKKPSRPFVGNGGAGSGNFGHTGRPGEQGGSGGGGGESGGELSPTETAAVESWWQGGYEDINTMARRGKVNDEIRALDSAIAKSAPLENAEVVYRGMSLPEGNEVIGNLKKGFSFGDDGFVAVSEDAAIAENFAVGGDFDNKAVILEIKLPAGIRALPIPSGIKEKLLPRGKGFFFVDSVKRSKGVSRVQCRYVVP